jgi:4-phytase/acid phosphatase
MRHWIPALLLALGFVSSAAAGDVPAGAPDSDLAFVLILSRHGIRAPLLKNEGMRDFAAGTWATWEVPLGHLTPHGRENVEQMGSYYRSYYVAQGLLTGQPERDRPSIFFRADADERTIGTARALGAGLLPATPITVHTLPDEAPDDPLFHPSVAFAKQTDSAVTFASRLGREGGDPALPVEENHLALQALEQVVFGGDGTPPPGKRSIFDVPPSAKSSQGTLWMANRLIDAITLAYMDGKPPAEAGWGRLNPTVIMQLMTVSALSFDLGERTFYSAQVGASDLAEHILDTLQQAARGQPVAGAIGPVGERMAVLVGHDSNLIPLAGLMNIGWRIPGTASNPVLPGGALVFELRRRRSDGRYVVRTRYMAETIEQLRAGATLSLEHPPALAPIFVPNASLPTPGYDAPLDRFDAHLRPAIDPTFTAPEPAGVR